MPTCLPISRRKLLSAGVAAGFGGLALPAFAASRSPNEKLHVAVIGVGGMRGGAVFRRRGPGERRSPVRR